MDHTHLLLCTWQCHIFPRRTQRNFTLNLIFPRYSFGKSQTFATFAHPDSSMFWPVIRDVTTTQICLSNFIFLLQVELIKSIGNPDALWLIDVVVVWHICFRKWESDKFNIWPWIKSWQSLGLWIFFCNKMKGRLCSLNPKLQQRLFLYAEAEIIEEPWWVTRTITVWLFIVLVLLCCCSGSLESHRGIFNLGQTKHQCVSAELQTFEGLFLPLEHYQPWRHCAQWPLVWPTVRLPQITQNKFHCKFQEIHNTIYIKAT